MFGFKNETRHRMLLPFALIDAFEIAILNKIVSCRRLAIKLVHHIFYICNDE